MNTPTNSKTPLKYLQHSQQLPHSCFPSIYISLIQSDLRTLSKTWGVYPQKANLKRNCAQFQIEIAPTCDLGARP